jgi:hypothetical protein
MGDWITTNRQLQDPLSVRATQPTVPSTSVLPLTIERPTQMKRSGGWVQVDVFSPDGRVVHWQGGKTAAPGGPPGPRLVVVTTASEPVPGLDRPEAESVDEYLAAWDQLGEGEIPPDLVAEIALLEVVKPPPAVAKEAPAQPIVTKPPVAKATVSRPSAPAAQAANSPDRRCSAILTKLTLGERLSDADRDVLQNKCGG